MKQWRPRPGRQKARVKARLRRLDRLIEVELLRLASMIRRNDPSSHDADRADYIEASELNRLEEMSEMLDLLVEIGAQFGG